MARPSPQLCWDRPRAYLPEPLDLLAVLGVVSVNRVLLPVAHVYLLHAAQHQLQGGTGISSPGPAPSPQVYSASLTH